MLAELRSQVIWIRIHQEVCFRPPQSARGRVNSDRLHCRFASFKWGLSRSSDLRKQRHLLNKKPISPSIGCARCRRHFCLNKRALPTRCARRSRAAGGDAPTWRFRCPRDVEGQPERCCSLCSCWVGAFLASQPGFALLGELLGSGQGSGAWVHCHRRAADTGRFSAQMGAFRCECGGYKSLRL